MTRSRSCCQVHHCATGSERRHYISPLPRPNTEEHSMFMATDSGDLMELAKYQMEHESFTADGPLETDQPVYMATPVDALFFALAPLYKHNDRFWPLKDIVEDCLLLKVIRSCSDRMQHIADVEGCCAIKNGDVTVPAGTM
ncbi:ribonuclease H2 subunit B-like isoform X3 [Amblyomma americanum]